MCTLPLPCQLEPHCLSVDVAAISVRHTCRLHSQQLLQKWHCPAACERRSPSQRRFRWSAPCALKMPAWCMCDAVSPDNHKTLHPWQA